MTHIDMSERFSRVSTFTICALANVFRPDEWVPALVDSASRYRA